MISMTEIKPKKALTIIVLMILNFVVIWGSADWVFTPLCFIALSELILAFDKLKHKKITRGMILVALTVLNFIAILAAAGWSMTPLVLTAAANLIMVFERIDDKTITDAELNSYR